jgi:TRAP-type mannitol/chloroaromatic compound transport system permease large subunit
MQSVAVTDVLIPHSLVLIVLADQLEKSQAARAT